MTEHVRCYVAFNGVPFTEALLLNREMVMPIVKELYDEYKCKISREYWTHQQEEANLVLSRLKTLADNWICVELVYDANPVESRFCSTALMHITREHMTWNRADGGKGALYEFYNNDGVIASEDHRKEILTELKERVETADFYKFDKSDITILRKYIMGAKIGASLSNLDYKME